MFDIKDVLIAILPSFIQKRVDRNQRIRRIHITLESLSLCESEWWFCEEIEFDKENQIRRHEVREGMAIKLVVDLKELGAPESIVATSRKLKVLISGLWIAVIFADKGIATPETGQIRRNVGLNINKSIRVVDDFMKTIN